MTDKEQLLQMRKEIIHSKMEGKSQAEKDLATKNLHRMEFEDHSDFIAYVSEMTGSAAHEAEVKPATDEELDAVMGHMFPGQTGYKPKAGEATSKEIEEVFKHLNI